jgi:hypothetical protein
MDIAENCDGFSNAEKTVELTVESREEASIDTAANLAGNPKPSLLSSSLKNSPGPVKTPLAVSIQLFNKLMLSCGV